MMYRASHLLLQHTTRRGFTTIAQRPSSRTARQITTPRAAAVLSRYFSAPPDGTKKERGALAGMLEKLSFERGGLGQGLLLGGGALALYGVSTALLDTVYAMMSLKPVEMGLYGFYSGAVSAMLGSGGAWWAQRSVFITPEPVYKAAFRAVYKDSNAVKALGGGRIKNVGDIQAYKTEVGGFKIGDNNRVEWSPPRAFLAFKVGGNTGEAVVLVEGKRTGFRTELTYLRVDTPSSALLLKGTSERHERLEDWAGAVEFRRKMLP